MSVTKHEQEAKRDGNRTEPVASDKIRDRIPNH